MIKVYDIVFVTKKTQEFFVILAFSVVSIS
ncbi:hypothetical protein DFQ08_106103 [Winogradskyella arenosi]|uniref:Uncharacterized protein n=1 Tax=Winogradskyella arenosi TaxID=533325 RepID=A0A368ZB46_9FLAO|nr:hypothetical protein DFQ08_106103 [Winogradskyella arenosi]